MSDILEDSVIEATPVRKKVKKKKCRPKHEKKTNVLTENNPMLQLNKCPIRKNKSQCDINVICTNITDPIHSTKSRSRYNHYVFYTIEEILKFSLKCFPTNNWLHVMGIYSYSTDLNCPFLCSTTIIFCKQAEIKLHFSSIMNLPKESENIIVYGFLNFDSNLPIIYVNFFKVCDVNYKAYIKLMLELRTTVPLENYKTEDISNDALQMDQTLSTSAYRTNDFCDKFEGLEETLGDSSVTDSQLCSHFDNIL